MKGKLPHLIGPLAGLFWSTVLFCLALALLEAPDATGWSLPVRFALSCASLLILPGWAFISLVTGGQRPSEDDLSLPERISLAFAVSLILITALCITTQTLGWNMDAACHALFAVTGVLMALVWGVRLHHRLRRGLLFKPFAAEADEPAAADEKSRTGRLLTPLLLLLVAVLGGLLYGLGVPFSIHTGEDMLTLVIVRKLLHNSAITTSNYFYRPGYQLAYIYVPYHFLLAMLSRLCGADPIVVYHRFRAFAGLMSLCIQYSLVRTWFRNPLLARIVVLTEVTLVYASSMASCYITGPSLEWGQLVPFTHYGDFGLGITMPLGLLLVRQAVDRNLCLFLAPLYLLSVAVLHSREALHVLFITGIWILTMLLLRPVDWKAVIRLTAICLVVVAGGMAYRGITAQNAVVMQYEQDARAGYQALLNRSIQDPVYGLLSKPIFDWTGQQSTQEILGKPFWILPLFFTPLLLLYRRNRWALLLFCTLAVPLVVITVPLASILFALATFSSVLISGEVFLYPWVYILVGVGVFFIVHRIVLHLEIRPAARVTTLAGAALVGWGGLALLEAMLSPVARHNAGFAMCSVALGSLGVFLAMRRRPDWTPVDFTRITDFSVPGAAALATVILLTGMFIEQTGFRRPGDLILSNGQPGPAREDLTYRPRHQPTVFELYLGKMAAYPDETTAWDFYAREGLDRIPRSVMQFIRDGLEESAVFDAPASVSLLIPFYSQHYVVSTGTPYMLDADFNRKYGAHHPLFCAETDFDGGRADRYLKELGIEYVLASPEFAPGLKRHLGPGHRVLFERDGWLVFGPRPGGFHGNRLRNPRTSASAAQEERDSRGPKSVAHK